jgi:uncharacterized repeat protein (TIGR01451 family)
VLSKQIALINGVAPSGMPTLQAGDVVTWELSLSLYSGDQQSVVLTDFLPRPLFDSQEHGATPTFGSAPFRFGAANTLPAGTTVTMSTSDSSNDNSVTFTIGAFQTQPSTQVTVVIDMDFTVVDAPRENGLVFTNLGESTVNGTGVTHATSNVVASFQDLDPELLITLGAVQTSHAGATFSPAAINSGPYTSNSLDMTPVQNSVSGVDAADTITYRLIIQNRGNTPAYNVSFSDSLPANLSCSLTSIEDGTGVALGFGGSLASTLTLDNPIPAYSGTSGLNLAVAELACTVGSSVPANQSLQQTAQLLAYTSVADPGAPNFVDSSARNQSVETTQTINFRVTLTATGVANVDIRDSVPYSLTLTIPEGSTDAVQLVVPGISALALDSSTGPTLNLPAGVTSSNGGSSVVGIVDSTGEVLTWNLGTLTNSNTNDAVDQATATLNEIVLNNSSAKTGNPLVEIANVTAGATTLATASSTARTVKEPLVTLTQTVSPSTADAGDTVTITATLKNAGALTAYEPTYHLTAPSQCASLGTATTSGALASATVSQTSTTTDLSVATIAAGASGTISFTCSIPASVTFGSTVTLPGSVQWTSHVGTPTAVGNNPLTVERTGNTSNPGGAVNDYLTPANTALTIRAVDPTETNSATGNVVVGQLVTFDVTVNIPEGTSSSSTVQQAFTGLAFVSAQGIASSPSVTCGGVACTLPAPTVASGGKSATWAFTNINNTDNNNSTTETITFTVTAAVTNVAAASKGLMVSATLTGGGNTQTTHLTVAEPSPTFTVTSAPASGDSGDAVTVSVHVQNPTSDTLTSAAYDSQVAFTLPTGMAGVTFPATTCPVTTATASGQSVVVAFNSIPVGTDCSFSFVTTLTDAAVVGSTLVGSGTATWSSLAGDVTTSQSTYSSVASERTGNPSNPGGALNNYLASPSFSTGVAGTTSAALSLQSTDSAQTNGASIALGELATYEIDLVVPEGTLSTVQVTDTPPPGMQLLSVSLVTTGFNGTVQIDPTSTNLGVAVGHAATYALGTIVNTGDNVTTNNQISLIVTARGSFDPTVLGSSNSHSATLNFGGASRATGAVPVMFVVPRPRLTGTLSTYSRGESKRRRDCPSDQ